MEERYCPILLLRNKFQLTCKGKECAWYDTEREDCCIKVAADSLDTMVSDDGFLNTWIHHI